MSDSDQIPLSRKSLTPIHGVPTVSPLDDVNNRVDMMIIKLDRIHQQSKLLRWVAGVAITFALGSILAVAKMLYGMGSDDATARAAVERAQRQADEVKADVRELQKFVYRRFGADTTRPTSPLNKDDQ